MRKVILVAILSIFPLICFAQATTIQTKPKYKQPTKDYTVLWAEQNIKLSSGKTIKKDEKIILINSPFSIKDKRSIPTEESFLQDELGLSMQWEGECREDGMCIDGEKTIWKIDRKLSEQDMYGNKFMLIYVAINDNPIGKTFYFVYKNIKYQ